MCVYMSLNIYIPEDRYIPQDSKKCIKKNVLTFL